MRKLLISLALGAIAFSLPSCSNSPEDDFKKMAKMQCDYMKLEREVNNGESKKDEDDLEEARIEMTEFEEKLEEKYEKDFEKESFRMKMRAAASDIMEKCREEMDEEE